MTEVSFGDSPRARGDSRAAAAKWRLRRFKKHLPVNVAIDTLEKIVETRGAKGALSLASTSHTVSHVAEESQQRITSIQRDFANAVYLGSERNFDGKDIDNHYFCYPINYDGKRRLVFCRACQDVNKNRLYVHEVFLEDEIKSNALQTAAPANIGSQQPHGGIALCRSVLQSVFAVNPISVTRLSQKIAARGIHEAIAKRQSLDASDGRRIANILGSVNRVSKSSTIAGI